jgi:hypothetical protein
MLLKTTKNMKKVIYAILPLFVVSVLVFANREIKNETSKKSTPKPLSAAEMKAEREKWYMEAVVTSLSPAGSRSDFGVMVRINGYDYILGFGPEKANEFQQLHSLKVNDKIIIRSVSVFGVLYAPRNSYPIIAGDYVERDGKIIYKGAPRKGGC